jgi:hypothetical protein
MKYKMLSSGEINGWKLMGFSINYNENFRNGNGGK